MRFNRWISCLFVICISTTGCAGLFSKPEVTGVRPRITGIDMKGVNMEFDVDVNNPNLVPIKAPRFKYDVAVEGSSLASGETESAVDLPANKAGTAVLPVRMSYADIMDAASKVAGQKEFSYALNGAFVVSALGKSYELPISHSGKLPVLRPPKFSNVKLNVSNVSMGSAAIAVDADMENPNIFELGVNTLGYELNLGDTAVGELQASTPSKIAAGQSGHITLNGKVSGASAVLRLLQGGLGMPKIVPTGSIETPYGPVSLEPAKDSVQNAKR